MMISCLCSFIVLRTLVAEHPVNKKVPEPFFVKNRVRVRTVWWAVQDSNRAAARSAVSNQPSGLLLSPRFLEN